MRRRLDAAFTSEDSAVDDHSSVTPPPQRHIGAQNPLPTESEWRRDPASSEARFRRELDSRPTNADALTGYAQFLLQTGNSETSRGEAGGLLLRAVTASPSHIPALVALCEFHADGDADAAERFAASALGAGPADPRALTAHAVCLEKRGDAVGAEEAHRDAVRAEGAPVETFRRFARFMEARGMHEAAAELYKEALSIDEGDAESAFLYGRLLAVGGNATAAEPLLRVAVDAGVGGAVCELGGVLASRGDVYGSEEMYRRALRGDPGDAGALRGYAALLEEGMGDAKSALELVNRALEVDPDHEGTLCRLARLTQDFQKDYSGAEAIYQRVLAQSMGDADLLFDYGRLLEDARGNTVEAERMFRRALQVDPMHVGALSSLGLLLEETRGDTGAAEMLYQRALAVSPADVGTLYNYGVLLQVRWTRFAAHPGIFFDVFVTSPDLGFDRLGEEAERDRGRDALSAVDRSRTERCGRPSCAREPTARLTRGEGRGRGLVQASGSESPSPCVSGASLSVTRSIDQAVGAGALDALLLGRLVLDRVCR